MSRDSFSCPLTRIWDLVLDVPRTVPLLSLFLLVSLAEEDQEKEDDGVEE